MASLMRRAVQQAKAEAAAAKVQAQQIQGGDATANARLRSQEQVPKPAGGDKQALASVLKKAAQLMQQQEAATESDTAPPSLARTATTQQGPGSLQDFLLNDAGLVEALQPQAQAGTTQGASTPGEEQLAATRSRTSSCNSTEDLLLGLPPERHQSLGKRLSAMLRGALTLSRQSSYVSLAADDADANDSVAAISSLVRRRALPRDASYLPEWLNRTLSSSSGGGLHDAALETQNLLQEQAEDASELPQWVDWSTMQLKEDAAPGKLRPAPLALPVDETASTQLVLESEPTTAQSPPTPKGHRLFEFWQQKSAAAATGPLDGQAPAPSLPLAHAQRPQAVPQKRGQLSLQASASKLEVGPAQPQSDLSHMDWGEADLPLQHVVEGLQAQPAHPTHSEVTAELAATSRLVQQQSARQAELLEGLEHALSQISQHCLVIQNPTAHLEPSAGDLSEDQTGVVSAYLRD